MLRTDGPNPLTSRAYAATSTRSRTSARSTARPGPPTRPTPRSSGRTTLRRSGTASSARSPRAGAGHRRQRAAVRDDEPGRGRRGDRLLERQVPLELLAPDHRDPRGRERRQPGDRGRPGLDAAVRPATPVARRPPLVTPPFPDHPSGHNCAAGAIVHTLQDFFGTDKVAFSASATSPAPRGASTASPTRSRRTSTPASGPASTSAPPTSRAPCSARRSRTSSHKHYFQPVG